MPKKPRTRWHHGDLREALVGEAVRALAQDGLHAISLRHLARGLGVSEAAPYHHFASRDALLAEVAARGYRALHARFVDELGRAGPDPFDRLRGLGRAYVAYALEAPGSFRAMFGAQMIALAEDPAAYAAGSATRLLFEQTVRDCVGERDTPTVARTFWSLVHGVAWLVLEREIRFEPGEPGPLALAEEAMALLVAGTRTARGDGLHLG